MKQKYTPIFYCSFGTKEEQQKQIKKFFGNSKLKEIYLSLENVDIIKSEIEEKLPNANYEYGIGGFMYSVLVSDSKNALYILKSIIKNNNLESKFTIKNNAVVSKDLIYAEQPIWMGISGNKYEQKIEDGGLSL